MTSRTMHKVLGYGVAISLLVGGIAVDSILTPAEASAPANTSFPDTQNYWGQPFINALAERNIVAGYLDNTFRPENPINRDEYAAILRQAFSQNPERQISSGSVYTDVPADYWAAPAIEEAYEMGFMKGYPGGEFRPQQPVSKVEVLVSLAQNLNLTAAAAGAASAQTTAIAPAAAMVQPAARRQTARKPLMFPLAATALLQPLMALRSLAAAPVTATPAAPPPPAAATAEAPAASPTEATTAAVPQRPVSVIVSNYYADADQIPQYAVDDVARATLGGIVVNYPDTRVLNPNQPATRGEVAALIYQALVNQGRIDPLPADAPATSYIVGR